MARVIMSAPKGMTVDHINHDTLDNRRSNLRLATYSENLKNRGKSKANTSGFTGVGIHKGKYRACIQKNGKQISLGHFETIKEAVNVRKLAEEQLYGEFRYRLT